MSTNATKQTVRELDVFARFIHMAGLPIDAASVQKCEPPAPDILCRHATDGPLAFELAKLINHDFSARLSRQSKTQNALESAHEHLPAPAKQLFDQQFANANLYFTFHPDATKNKVRGKLSDVFAELSGLPNGFVGDVNDFASNPVKKILKSVSISRGGFNGPNFSVENIGGLGDSVVPKIKDKLAKTYESNCPIELLGYLDIAGMFPPQLWKGPANAFFAGLSDLGPFRRIWIVDLRNGSVEIVHNAA